jgi:hypothetical protein
MAEWDGTEAECHSENVECFENEDGNFELSTARIDLFKSRYNRAKVEKVGHKINCPTCNKEHTKTTYHKIFCGNVRCKDEFWNTVDDKRRARAKEYKRK